MAADGSAETTAARAVLAPPGRSTEWHRLVPGGRPLAIALGLLAAAALVYLAARQTSVFAVRQIAVEGAGPALSARVQGVLRPTLGTSLLALDGDEIESRLSTLPGVVSAEHDRSFPHTLRVFVRAERSVAVLRRGSESWLVSARGRVLRPLRPGARLVLPRVWVPSEVSVSNGAVLADPHLRAALAAAALLRPGRPPRVRVIRVGEQELTLVLRSFTELRLGDSRSLRLKLAVARRVLRTLAGGGIRGGVYIDLSLPVRPVFARLPSS